MGSMGIFRLRAWLPARCVETISTHRAAVDSVPFLDHGQPHDLAARHPGPIHVFDQAFESLATPDAIHHVAVGTAFDEASSRSTGHGPDQSRLGPDGGGRSPSACNISRRAMVLCASPRRHRMENRASRTDRLRAAAHGSRIGGRRDCPPCARYAVHRDTVLSSS